MEVGEEPQPVASTSQDAAKPTQSRKRKAAEPKAVAAVKPEKPAAKSKASKSTEAPAPAPAAKGVKRARPTKEDVQGAKRAKLDEGRMGLRGPHLAAISAEGGLVLTLGQGDTGQVGSLLFT